MNQHAPLVSAVIPTRNRPQLVLRAVRSVLSQTLHQIECIVVVDGPDPSTFEALGQLRDPRLRVIALEHNVGGSEARNLGAQAARAPWVALLDDDDEWLPSRLQKQLDAAAASPLSVTMVASRFFDRGADNDDLLRPHIFPRPGQPISEFLWCEVSYFGGIAGFPQTSTWLLRRDFLLQVPFTPGLKLLQDLDWLLRAYSHPHMQVVFVPEPLSIFHNEQTRQRITRRIDWEFSRRWALQNRPLFTPKAFGFFLIVFCLNPAAQQAAPWPELRRILVEALRYGKITPKLLTLSFLYLCVYPWLSKALVPRRRAAMLYQLRGLARRAG